MAVSYDGGSGRQNPFGDLNIDIDPRRIAGIAFVVAIVLLIVVGVVTSFYTVAPEGRAVVKRFGKVVKVQEPGLHFKLPFWIDRAHFVPTERVLKEEFGFATLQPGQKTRYAKTREHEKQSLMLTGDLNMIDMEWVVQYRISDPDEFLHRVRNQRETIRVVSEAVMRRIVGNRLGSDVLTLGRVEIATEAQRQMQEILDSYEMGVRISTIELQDVTPPETVKPAFNEVNEARQQREKLINEAEKARNQAIPRAKGEALKIIAQAEGYAAERVNRAKGEASRFEAVLTEYKEAPEITRRRLYLEMIDDVMPKIGRVYFVQPGQSAPLPLLHLDERTRSRN